MPICDNLTIGSWHSADGFKLGLLVANYANWKGLFPMLKTLFTAVLRFVSRVLRLNKVEYRIPEVREVGKVSEYTVRLVYDTELSESDSLKLLEAPENCRAVYAYGKAWESANAGDMVAFWAWWAWVQFECFPSTLRSAESGGLERRSLGLGKPESYRRKGVDQKTFEAMSQRERKQGLGAYINAHRGYQAGQDPEAAAVGAYSRAIFKIMDHAKNGWKCPFRKLGEAGTTDATLRGYFGMTAARMLREEVYGRHRWQGVNGERQKPVSLGDHDVADDNQPEPVEALAETELVNSLLGEIANVLAFRDQAFVEAWAHKFDPKRANGEGENKWWELCGMAKSTANRQASELQSQLKERMASYDNDIAAKAFKETIDTLING